MTRYALFTYRQSDNLGDEIQSLAAKQFLPQIDYYVERDDLDEVTVSEGTRVIANGWYTHRLDTWPPKTRNLNPLFVAFHLTEKARETFSKPDVLAYLKEHEPIGCRDYSTLEFLQGHGVESYFSGCLTLTLPRRQVAKNDSILFVNMPREFESCVPDHLKDNLVWHDNDYTYSQLLRKRINNKFGFSTTPSTLSAAEKILDKFAAARLVVTTRLHCAMPCLAMGVPVYFVVPNPADIRFRGLVENANFLSLEQLKSDPTIIDWENEPSNPGSIETIRSKLIKTCEHFVKTGEHVPG